MLKNTKYFLDLNRKILRYVMAALQSRVQTALKAVREAEGTEAVAMAESEQTGPALSSSKPRRLMYLIRG